MKRGGQSTPNAVSSRTPNPPPSSLGPRQEIDTIHRVSDTAKEKASRLGTHRAVQLSLVAVDVRPKELERHQARGSQVFQPEGTERRVAEARLV